MTDKAKQKAEELVEIYARNTILEKDDIIQCALICVKERIKEIKYFSGKG